MVRFDKSENPVRSSHTVIFRRPYETRGHRCLRASRFRNGKGDSIPWIIKSRSDLLLPARKIALGSAAVTVVYAAKGDRPLVRSMVAEGRLRPL